MKHVPQFPPLLKGHRVPSSKMPVVQARAMLEKGKLGAGDILWSDDQETLNLALVLEPEVTRERCGEMLYLVMVAFADAAGAISEPEIAINYRWPSTILVNEASVGVSDLITSDGEQDGVPNWMILSLKIAIRPDKTDIDPGKNTSITTMWDEGCGDISHTQLLESVSRHIVNWIHTWGEDGFKPIHDQWMGRISEKEKTEPILGIAEYIGLDERGDALIKTGDAITGLSTHAALQTIREHANRSS